MRVGASSNFQDGVAQSPTRCVSEFIRDPLEWDSLTDCHVISIRHMRDAQQTQRRGQPSVLKFPKEFPRTQPRFTRQIANSAKPPGFIEQVPDEVLQVLVRAKKRFEPTRYDRSNTFPFDVVEQ